MSEVQRYKNYINSLGISNENLQYDFKDKDRSIDHHIAYMLSRTQSMFKWSNLPESVNERILELYLQCNGNCCWYEYEGKLYVFTGALGGEPDVYYMPTIYTIANPALKLSRNLRIHEECVVMPNDALYIGLLPIFKRNATLMTEIELSLNIGIINTRLVSLISAQDDNTYKSALKYLDDLKDGEQGVILENNFIEGLKTSQVSTSQQRNTVLQSLVETYQYVKASWYNEIGIDANYEMKKEKALTAELEINSLALLPLIDDMFYQRQTWIAKVNEMFGTDISVDLASSWKILHEDENHGIFNVNSINPDISDMRGEADEVSTDTSDTRADDEQDNQKAADDGISSTDNNMSETEDEAVNETDSDVSENNVPDDTVENNGSSENVENDESADNVINIIINSSDVSIDNADETVSDDNRDDEVSEDDDLGDEEERQI